MMLLYVHQFNGEHIGRTVNLITSHEQRRRLLLAVPPFHRRRQCLQGRERAVANHTEQIDIGELRMKISGHRRSEQDHALQVRASRGSQPTDKIVNHFLPNHLLPHLLPTAAIPAAPRTDAAESAKTSATAAESASS